MSDGGESGIRTHETLPGVEAALEPFEPRPHWGKLFRLTDLQSRFPRLSQHLELAESYDPRGKFGSDFLEGRL